MPTACARFNPSKKRPFIEGKTTPRQTSFAGRFNGNNVEIAYFPMHWRVTALFCGSYSAEKGVKTIFLTRFRAHARRIHPYTRENSPINQGEFIFIRPMHSP